MTKPFSMRELLARVKALLRRVEMDQTSPELPQEPASLVSNGLEMDVARRGTWLNREPLQLRPKEFDLLAFLLRNRGLVFSRDTLLERVWGGV